MVVVACLAAGAVGVDAGCTSLNTKESIGQVTSAVTSDSTVSFPIVLPLGAQPDEVFAAASGSLSIDNAVSLLDPTGTTAVGNSGAGTTNVGVGTLLGGGSPPTAVNLTSVGPVLLANNARITGSLTAAAPPTEQAGASVMGSVTVDPSLFLNTYSWLVTFPGTTQGDVDLAPNASRTLAPGAYGNVAVMPGAKLTLGPGTYTFASLDLEAQAVIQSATTASAPLIVYVQGAVIAHGAFAPSGGPSTFLLGCAGSSAIGVTAPFGGTLVAPNAALTLYSTNGPAQHQGAFFAQSIEIGPNQTTTHVPFGAWFSGAIPWQGPVANRPNPVVPTAPSLTLAPAPPLGGPNDVPAFLQWAYQATPSQIPAARALIQGVIGNESVAAAIVSALAADPDLGRNLVDIAVLGEMRTQTGLQYFTTLVNTPLPTTGTFLEEFGTTPIESVELQKRQARAVDGIALMMVSSSDSLLLNVISTTPSEVVKARAIHNYLWIHGPSGRAAVAALLPANQQILLDRFDVVATGPYDTRLATYLSLHPEAVPVPNQ